MKKLIVIMTLCAIQAACSGQQTVSEDRRALLSYEDFATEITIGLETLETDAQPAPDANVFLGTP